MKLIRWKTVLSLVKKEISTLLDTPTTSIALIIFIVLWEFLFFRNAFLVGEASLRILYDYIPWLLLFFSAAITMGVFSQEKNEGTLEVLLTHPVKDIEVVLSKFLSSLFFVSFALLFAIPVALAIARFGPFDWGAFLGQFFSSILLAASFVALGLFFSSLLASPIASLLATAGASFLFIIIGSDLITANLPLSVTPIFDRLSLLSHEMSMARGVIDVRDVWYFLSFIGIFLALTNLMLLKQKFGNRKDYFARYQIGIALFIGIAIMSTIVGSRIPGRLDLTSDKKYSISLVTKKTVNNLSDIVTITFYVSSKLPSQLTPIVRDVKDILRDYQQLGKGNIVLVTKDPSNNQDIASEASSRGVKEVQFNVIGQEEFQVKTGFVGIVISYGDTHETIPLIQSTGDLEYQLTSSISKLTSKEKKTIAFLSGHQEKNLATDYAGLNTELQKQFVTKAITIDEKNPFIASDTAVLVIAGPENPLGQIAQDSITSFIKSGKSVFFLLDGYSISPQSLTASPNKNSFSEFLKPYGVSVNPDIVYDLRSNATIHMGQGVMDLLVPYPYWIRSLPTKSMITNRLNGVVFPWASSISVDASGAQNAGYSVENLLTTSPYANADTTVPTLAPDQAKFSQEGLKQELLAISLSPGQQSTTMGNGRLIVVGNSAFLTDQFIQNSTQNITFGASAISWLANADSLASIKTKQTTEPRLLFHTATEPELIRFGNLGFAIIFPASLVLWRLLRRRSLRGQVYHKKSA